MMRKTTNLTFGEAIEAMKLGAGVARDGWNDKNMFIFMVFERSRQIKNLSMELSRAMAYLGRMGTLRYCTHINMINAQGDMVIGWLASQTDMTATDWRIVYD